MEAISSDKKYIYGICEKVSDYTKLCRINLITKKMEQCIDVPGQCGIIQIGNRIFLTGGFDMSNHDTTYEYLEYSNTLVEKKAMINGKFNHGVIALDLNNFWTVAGTNNSGFNTFCEEYDIQENSWKELPNLNVKKFFPSLVILDSFVYCIGGACSEHTVERIDYKLKNFWSIVTINSRKIQLDGSPAAFAISDSEIMIFAGGYLKDAGIYDTKNGTITKCSFSVKQDCFYFNPVRIMNGKVYILGGCYGNLHMYDISEKNYHFIAFEEIQ